MNSHLRNKMSGEHLAKSVGIHYRSDCCMVPTIAAEFLPELYEEDTLILDVEHQSFSVAVRRVEVGVDTNLFKYQSNRLICDLIVHNMEMETGMHVVFTKKPDNHIQLMVFNEDGTQLITGRFLGVTSLNPVEPRFSYDEE
ncbi:hypothetical protein Tco_1127778, partial [Tanacetum coccineum]